MKYFSLEASIGQSWFQFDKEEDEFLLGSGRGIFLGGDGDTILWSGAGSFFEEADLFFFFDVGVTLAWWK